jgi:hypothetical protein
VSDVQFVLSHNGCTTLAQQLVVMKQGTCNGILNSSHTNHRWVLADAVKHLLERRTTFQLYLLSLEVQVCCDIVERTYQSLYCNPFHILFLAYYLKKIRFHLVE